MEKISNPPDYIFLAIISILLVLGGLILVSVSASNSQQQFSSSFYYLNHLILFGFLPGILLAFLFFKINLNLLRKWSHILLLMTMVLLVMVFLPLVGINFRGASRWIKLGEITFQPSELLKPIFILYLASWFASRSQGQAEKDVSKTFLAFLVVIGILSILLICQPDISTLMITMFVATSMYFLNDAPLWHIFLIICIIFGGLIFLSKSAPYRLNRIKVFFNPELDPMGIGYQTKQALIATGSGGISGVGLGLSYQKFGSLPQSISDSIFSIFAEETGFIGSLILVLLYLALFWRGFKIGKEKKDKFAKLCAFGIIFWITIQAFINIGSMIGILPLTGIPLPFISYGGSALISELIGVGVLLNISKQI